ncbi:MAG: hypothetical protein LAO77_18305 [Acidobacteriia bacterium]|nr:hypothetical protein [Terriglobia bacterium]
MSTDLSLQRIVDTESDALLLHAGEMPVLLSRAGQTALSASPLAIDTITSFLARYLPQDAIARLRETGSVTETLPATVTSAGDPFVITATWAGDDVWVEIARERRPARPVAPPARAAAPARPAPARPALATPSTASAPFVDARPAATTAAATDMRRLLIAAAARGARALYLAPGQAPAIRVDGAVDTLAGEPALDAHTIERWLCECAPDLSRDELFAPEGFQWVSDLRDIGRVRLRSFRDQHGLGTVAAWGSAAVARDSTPLEPAIRRLCDEPDGLVLVASPPRQGKTSLVGDLVDGINHARPAYTITLEPAVHRVHERHRALISQRLVRGDERMWMAALRSALAEGPDVIALDAPIGPGLMAAILEGASSNCLILASVNGATAGEALDAFLGPARGDAAVRRLTSEVLRGVVAQVLLRRLRGGRVAAREVLVNIAAPTTLIAEDRFEHVPRAIEKGRRVGCVPLNDALIAHVTAGLVEAREAYRHSPDRVRFLRRLRAARPRRPAAPAPPALLTRLEDDEKWQSVAV